MRAEDLLGTWRLVGYRNLTPDGREVEASFAEAMGVMHIDPNGRMVVVLTDGRREIPARVGKRPFSAYTGLWTFDGQNLNVAVDESAWAHFVGSTQVRGVRLADGRLTLIPADVVVDGVVNHREVFWEKVAGP